jgi:type 1 fimbria pilin
MKFPVFIGGVILFYIINTTNACADNPLGWANFQASGTIISASCNVGTSSQNQTVNIGDFAANSFPSVGSVSPAKDFSIELTDCSNGITGTKITFSGTNDSIDPSLLALTDTTGQGDMASGVAVQILDGNTGSPIALNQQAEQTLLKAGDNSLPYQLRYKSTASTVTAGNATAVMYFDLSYQ